MLNWIFNHSAAHPAFSKSSTKQSKKLRTRFLSKLSDSDYSGAAEVSTAMKKFTKSNEFKIGHLYRLIKTHKYEEASKFLQSIKIGKSCIYKLSYIKIRLLLKIINEEHLEAILLLNTLEDDPIALLKKLHCMLIIEDTASVVSLSKTYQEKYQNFKLYFKLYRELAEKKYDKCIKTAQSADKDLENFIAYCFIKLEKYEDAHLVVSNSLNRSNQNEETWLIAGTVYYKLKNLSDAFYCFSALLRFQPENPNYLFNLSLVYQDNKQDQTAKSIVSKIKSINPNYNFPSDIYCPVIDLSIIEPRLDYIHPSICGIKKGGKSKIPSKHKRNKKTSACKAKKSRNNIFSDAKLLDFFQSTVRL